LPPQPWQGVWLDLAVAIFGAVFNQGDFGRGQLEQPVNAGVEVGFQANDLVGVLAVFGLPVE